VSENQQLQKDLMSTKSELEHATNMCKKKDGEIFNPAHSRAAGFKNAELK
jgi:centrosomal protein CEP63